jgi:amino acid transporter
LDTGSVVPVGTAIAGALTPAFLLAGVMTALRVLSERRNRSVDRIHAAHDGRESEWDIARLRLRARIALLSMLCCILSALLVCALVAATFVGLLYDLPLRPLVVALMLGAMAMLGAGLVAFFAEALLAHTDLPPEARK